MKIDHLISKLRARCVEAGGQRAFAEQIKVSPQYVSDVLRKRRDPGDKILKAMGLRRVVTYEDQP